MDEYLVRTISDIEEIERVPVTERIQARNTYQMLIQGSTVDPDKVAIHYMASGDAYSATTDITYGQFLDRVHQTANLFHDLGVGKQDVISIILPLC